MQRVAALLSIAMVGVFLWVVYSADSGQPSVLSQIWYGIPNGDKYGHAVLFGALTLAANILTKFRILPIGALRLFLGSVLVLVAAFAEELSQFMFPARTVDMTDLLSGMAGVVTASLLSIWLRKTLSSSC